MLLVSCAHAPCAALRRCHHGMTQTSGPKAFPPYRSCTQNTDDAAGGRMSPSPSAHSCQGSKRHSQSGTSSSPASANSNETACEWGATGRPDGSAAMTGTTHVRSGASKSPTKGRPQYCGDGLSARGGTSGPNAGEPPHLNWSSAMFRKRRTDNDEQTTTAGRDYHEVEAS